MRTQLSLLALVVSILAGQASAVSVSPLGELHKALEKDPHFIEMLSSKVVLKLSEDGYNAAMVEQLLYQAKDQSVEVCDGHTIGELLALNEVNENGKDDCTPDALEERAKYCSGLEKKANQADDDDVWKVATACNNVYRFCIKNVESVTEYCEKREILDSRMKVIEAVDPQYAVQVLSDGELDEDRIRDVLVLTENRDAVVCNGFKLDEISENIFEFTSCNKEELKTKFNFCESLKKDDDVACSNVRFFCRFTLGGDARFCVNTLTPKDLVKLDEQTIEGLTKANTYKFVEDYGEHLKAEFRNEMSPFEKIIANF